MTTALSVRLPEKLATALDQISEETERPKSFHIQKALELYFEERADLQIALDRLNDPTDPIISSDKMREQLDLQNKI